MLGTGRKAFFRLAADFLCLHAAGRALLRGLRLVFQIGLGQAAGTMLALFADVTQLNVSRLQEKLKENGVKLHVSEVL